MCKKITKLLIFLCIFAFSTNVKAMKTSANEQLCDIVVSNLGGGANRNTWNFEFSYLGNTVFQRGSYFFYDAKIGGKLAFCVNPGRMRGTTYVKVGNLTDIFSNDASKIIAQAYNFFQKSDGSLTARKFAQLMVWIATASERSKITVVREANYAYGTKSDTANVFVTNFVSEQNEGVMYYPTNGTCIKENGNRGSETYDSDKCNRTATKSLIEAFRDMQASSTGGNNSNEFSTVDSLCSLVVGSIRSKVSYADFNCELYRLIKPIQGEAATVDELISKYNIRPTGSSNATSRVANFKLLYNKLKGFTDREYSDFLFGYISNQGQEQQANSMWKTLANDLENYSNQFLSSDNNTSGFEIWCPYGANYSKASIKQNSVLKQCFVVKNPTPNDNTCPTTCNQLLITKEYGKGKKYPTCDSLKNIPGIDTCDESTGDVVITCGGDTPPGPGPNPPTDPPCEPQVPEGMPDEGFCRDKGTPELFELKDANDGVNDGDSINNACSSNNIAYKVDSGSNVVSSKDDELSTRYCSVYCWESLQAYLPQDFTSLGSKIDSSGFIISGRQFFWGIDWKNNIFATINTRRVCFTKNINYNQYQTDWNQNENNIVNTYNNYKKHIDFRNANGYTPEACKATQDCIGGYQAGGAGPWTATSKDNCINNGLACRCSTGIVETYPGQCESSGGHWEYQSTTPSVCNCPSGWTRNGNHCEKDGTKYKRDHNGISGTTTCYVDTPGNIESVVDHLKDSEINSLYSQLQNLINNRKDYYTAIKYCQTDRGSEKYYKHIATMTLETNQILDSKYKVNKQLVSNVEHKPITLMTNNPNGRTNTACYINVTTYDQSQPLSDGVNCADTNVDKFENVTWEYNGINNFSYDDTFLFSVIQEGAYFANSFILQNIGDEVVRYDAQYHGIPVSFNFGTGVYEISVDINGLGNNGHFDRIKNSSDFSYGYDFTKYTCPVIINNMLYENDCRYKPCTDGSGMWCLDTSFKSPNNCPPKPDCTTKTCPVPSDTDGIDLVYRLIEMGAGNTSMIFPGIEGEGRNTRNAIGANWSSFISSKNEKYKYITTYKNVYETEPLYSIELTPSLITEIRSSNSDYRGAKLDPYTSYRDPDNKYKIKCNKETGEVHSCVSTYLTKYMGSSITGLFATTDESKRIDLIQKYKTCYTKDASCLK